VLASGLADRTVTLWESGTGTVLRVLKGHSSGVVSVAFSPDGHTLASAAAHRTITLADGRTLPASAAYHTIALWDIKSRDEPHVLPSRAGRYRLGGDIAGSFWHAIGLCRFESGELGPAG
jgi:WD domain, G-beta repeat